MEVVEETMPLVNGRIWVWRIANHVDIANEDAKRASVDKETELWDFRYVTRTLSAIGSVSASRSVRSERFYCTATMSVDRIACIA